MTNNKFSILESDNKSYLIKQVHWIEKQLHDFKEDSFKHFERTRKEFERGLLTPMSPPKVIHAFRDEFLSETGLKKLNTTLKVFKKRESDKRSKSVKLEVILDCETRKALTRLQVKSGLSQTEIIKQLIENEAGMQENILK